MSHRLPAWVKAVFFDMDGTLIDSEPLTDKVVGSIIREHDLPGPSFPLAELHGKTWDRIEAELYAEYPALRPVPLVGRMQLDFDACMRTHMPLPIGGAAEAFLAAGRHLVTGIVSSSPRTTIEFVAERLGLLPACRVLVGAENVRQSKPHPECYLVAASYAHVRPANCLVFEDSVAGLDAARAAGMTAVGVIGNRPPEAVAGALASRARFVIGDYAELPGDFFAVSEPVV